MEEIYNKDGKNEMKHLYVLNNQLDVKKRIVIFGTGYHAKDTYLELIKRGIKPDYFADRKPDVIGLKLYGIEIISEESLKDLECQIIVASTAWENIYNRLVRKGIGTERIYVDRNRYEDMEIEL